MNNEYDDQEQKFRRCEFHDLTLSESIILFAKTFIFILVDCNESFMHRDVSFFFAMIEPINKLVSDTRNKNNQPP